MADSGSTKKICSVEGCDDPTVGRVLCRKHYTKWRRSRADGPKCKIEGCEKPVDGRELCAPHLKKLRRHGDPLGGNATPAQRMDFIKSLIDGPPTEDCIIWPYGRTTGGYGTLCINRKRTYVHRYVLELFSGPPSGEANHCLHKCGKGHLGCVNPRHLKWGTHQENMKDIDKHGTRAFGEKSGHAKLNECQVLEIRRLYKEGNSQPSLGKMFSVNRGTIGEIVRGEIWRHLL